MQLLPSKKYLKMGKYSQNMENWENWNFTDQEKGQKRRFSEKVIQFISQLHNLYFRPLRDVQYHFKWSELYPSGDFGNFPKGLFFQVHEIGKQF